MFYKYCLIDGDLEKVSNCLVEPPGVFRGRGEHPHAGRLKSRIVPEFVSINIGPDNPIPICPIPGHAWKKVISNSEATWLCQFKDERNPAANTKYVFLAAESKIKGENDRKKYEKARKLKVEIENIRRNYNEKMRSQDIIENQLGVCTYLIDKLALRVGNEKGEDEADTVGCCSLRVEHISFEDGNKITLDFLGKDSIRFHSTVEVEPIVFQNLRKFAQGKNKDEDLFDRINASRLNDYLKEMMSDLSAKVFRTYNASITLQNQLHEKECDEKDNIDVKVKNYTDCNREVARLCNHQKAVSKNHEEQVKKMREKLDKEIQKLKELEDHKLKLKKSKASANPGMPKCLDSCEASIAKQKKVIEAEKLKIENKEENKHLALGTSKINYMDPRITISWCKAKEVPIEKIFPKTLRSKFSWAMGNTPDWKF